MKLKRKIEIIIASNLHAAITGACRADIFGKGSPRVVRLTYTDGTTEEAYLTVDEITRGKANWMEMVGIVQDTARNKSWRPNESKRAY